MSSRERILGNIRARLDRPAEEADAVEVRLQTHPGGPIPARAVGDPQELRTEFIERARTAAAEVIEVGDPAGLPAIVRGLCDEHGWTATAVADAEPLLDELDWASAGVDIEHRPAGGADHVGISLAFCGVAETGTVVLCSGETSATTTAYLPEIHIVVLDDGLIVGSYEESWQYVRAAVDMPRAVNWITGPSRSADIEQSLQLGAHGPMRLVIALV